MWAGPTCSTGTHYLPLPSFSSPLFSPSSHISLSPFFFSSRYYAAQNEPIQVEINTTSPGISVGSTALTNSLFHISIKSISETSQSGSSLRSLSLASVNFTMTNQTSGENGKNTKYVYSTLLDNGAMLDIIVSHLLPLSIHPPLFLLFVLFYCFSFLFYFL